MAEMTLYRDQIGAYLERCESEIARLSVVDSTERISLPLRSLLPAGETLLTAHNVTEPSILDWLNAMDVALSQAQQQQVPTPATPLQVALETPSSQGARLTLYGMLGDRVSLLIGFIPDDHSQYDVSTQRYSAINPAGRLEHMEFTDSLDACLDYLHDWGYEVSACDDWAPVFGIAAPGVVIDATQ